MNKLNTDVFNLYCIKENNKYNIGIAIYLILKLVYTL